MAVTFLTNEDKKELEQKIENAGSKVTVDAELSNESENPVQNKVITSEINQLKESKTDLTLFEKLLSKLGFTMEDLEVLISSLPVVKLVGNTTGISGDDYVNVTCNFEDSTNNISFTDYAEIAWQGSSSLNFPKKNYKIKLYSDEERTDKNKRTFKDWHATNNYHLKCNYGDCTNFMNNMMMDFLTKSYQYLTPLPRTGARYTVDGFPVLLYLNDEFLGIYFWNLKQDDKVYNLTDDTDLCYQIGLNNGSSKGDNSGAFVYGNLNSGSNSGKNFADAHAEIDYYWEDRVWDKTSNHPDVLYNTIQWVSEATDDEFKANLENYFNKEYLIHYFVMMYTCGMGDSICKNFNMLYFPEKGVWYPTFWDMDFAFGTNWSLGTSTYTIDVLSSTYGASRLFTKLWSNFKNECKAKYWELRNTVLTVDQVKKSINSVWGNVTDEMIEQNKIAKYGASNTSFKTDGASYVETWTKNRLAYVDSLMVIEEPEEPEEPDTPTDVLTTSISLSDDNLNFTDTEPKTLVATVEPSNSTQPVFWNTSDNSVATVVNGVVKPVGNGNCTITVTSGECSDNCEVAVSIEIDDSVETYVTKVIQGNIATNATEDNRVTMLMENVTVPSHNVLRIKCKDGYSVYPYALMSTTDESLVGTVSASNYLYTSDSFDQTAFVAREWFETVNYFYNAEPNDIISKCLGFLVKKNDDTAISVFESKSAVIITVEQTPIILCEYGGIVSNTGENEEVTNKMRTVDFIDVSGKTQVTVNGTRNVARCYRADETYIGACSNVLSNMQTYTLLEGTSFIRLIFSQDGVSAIESGKGFVVVNNSPYTLKLK